MIALVGLVLLTAVYLFNGVLNGDIRLMARVVQGEANPPFTGTMVEAEAVAWTVKNRVAVKSTTYEKIVFQKYQYAKKPYFTPMSLIAAKRAYRGTSDLTDGATHFVSPIGLRWTSRRPPGSAASYYKGSTEPTYAALNALHIYDRWFPTWAVPGAETSFSSKIRRDYFIFYRTPFPTP